MNAVTIIKPYEMNRARQQRLTLILTGTFGVLTICLTIVSTIGAVLNEAAHPLLASEFTVSAMMVCLFLLARRNLHILAAHLLLLLHFSLYFYLILTYGVSLTSAELLAAATITMAGVMLQARYILIYCIGLALSVTTISFLQAKHTLHPDLSWRLSTPIFSDAVAFAALFLFIGVIIWISAREIDHLLLRSRLSEQALLKEKNSLEKRVKQRTKALELSHIERTLQNQRLIQCGQLYASLIHDLLNPLTSVNMQLGRISSAYDNDAVKKAQTGLKHIERFITGARKQLNGQSRRSRFSVSRGLRDALELVRPIVDRKDVSIKISQLDEQAYLVGDPVRFSQIIINLVLNAVQSYPSDVLQKSVSITYTSGSTVVITVQDKGRGMTAKQISQISEPFHSNRADGSTGLGIGLYLVRQYVTNDLNGSITITPRSRKRAGTIVTITLPSARKLN